MQITLCLYPRFSNFCLANTLEPLRAANDLAGRSLYGWRIVSPDGRAVRSSSGLEITPDAALETARGTALFLLPSYGVRDWATPADGSALRRAAARHEIVAGLDTGAWLMAAAGLLEGRAATIHWDEFDSFSETFPQLRARPDRVVRDGSRWTCGGATTAFDLVLGLIEAQHGPGLRLEVAGLFMHGEWRGRLPERPSGEARVDAAVALMRRHLAAPLGIVQIARAVGVSPRRLEALFADRLTRTPRRVYKEVRLQEARRLLVQTALPIGDIAARCGYLDASAMGRAFRAMYGAAPSALRRAARRERVASERA